MNTNRHSRRQPPVPPMPGSHPQGARFPEPVGRGAAAPGPGNGPVDGPGNASGPAGHRPDPDRLGADGQRVMTARQLRRHGVGPAALAERIRPGGPWQRLLPDVYLLHDQPPTSRDRVQAALVYAGRDQSGHGPLGGGREAMVTGLAALALHGFASVPPLPGLRHIEVLVPQQRRLRATGGVLLHRSRQVPRPDDVGGLPCAPVPRALADAVRRLPDALAVRRVLTEAVMAGHCDGAAVVRELAAADVLDLPHVAAAANALEIADRVMGEERLYALVRRHQLPDPVWNVELVLPGGPPLGGVDAYWPDQAVAVCVDARAAAAQPDDEESWARYVRQRERLDALGIALVHVTPTKLRASPEQQAAVIRTALMAAADGDPAAYVAVIPR